MTEIFPDHKILLQGKSNKTATFSIIQIVDYWVSYLPATTFKARSDQDFFQLKLVRIPQKD